MFATLSKPILVCGLTWVFAGSLALTALPLPTDQQSAPQEALQKSKETSVDDKVVSECCEDSVGARDLGQPESKKDHQESRCRRDHGRSLPRLCNPSGTGL